MAAKKTFVGFGCGPIQSGLFLYEAARSGNFRRLVVAEIDCELIEAVSANSGRLHINIAHSDGVQQAAIEGVELLNPRDDRDRRQIIRAIAESDEMATALPSVESYQRGGDNSVAALLGEGLSLRQTNSPAVIYTAENNNHAAESLAEILARRVAPAQMASVQTLNTVIGKMSGCISDHAVIENLKLEPIAPGIERAVLIEKFNRILISRINLPGYSRGLDVFEEKLLLAAFEDAKLYGHNAVHSLIAYMAELRGFSLIGEALADHQIRSVARSAFMDECAAGLIHRHGSCGDAFFTTEGIHSYAEDLLARMACVFLNDQVYRVGRDHPRKLARDDRLFGAMQLCMDAGIAPVKLAMGAAACVISLIKRRNEYPQLDGIIPTDTTKLDYQTIRQLLTGIWGQCNAADEALIKLTAQATKYLV